MVRPLPEIQNTRTRLRENVFFTPMPSEPSPTPLLSVIVPVLNEASRLPECLRPVLAAAPSAELLVADGGSGDGSPDLARSLGAQVLRSPHAGRAAQMNLGAAAARGSVLVFLHADTILPPNWHHALRQALASHPNSIGGVFRRRFDTTSAWLRLTCRLADWRARRFGWFLGDQTILVRRETFESIGGYRSLSAFEDLDLSRRLRTLGPSFVVPVTTITSAHRFATRGPLVQTLADLRLTLHFLRHPDAYAIEPSSDGQPAPR